MANKHVATPTLIECPNASCEALIQPHTACPRCGYYQGREVIEINTERRARLENA
jgi:large subunit ribosomal protein L32